MKLFETKEAKESQKKAKRLKEAIDLTKINNPKDWSLALDKELSRLQVEKTISVALTNDLDGFLKAVCLAAKIKPVLTKADVKDVHIFEWMGQPVPSIELRTDRGLDFESLGGEGKVKYKNVTVNVNIWGTNIHINI